MILLKKPRQSQPQTSVSVDAGSNFGRGFVDGYTFGSGVPRRLIGGSPVTSSGGSPALSPSSRALKLSGSASYLQIPAVSGIAGGTQIQVTFVAHITSQDSEMLMELSATADSNAGFYLYGLNASTLRVQTNGGGGTKNTDFTGTLPSRPCVITVRCDVGGSGHQAGFWVDGVQYFEGAQVSGSGPTGSFLGNALNIGSRNAGSLSSDGSFGDLWIHNRWMPESELRAFHANPWAIYEPRRIWVPVSVAGGGGAINLTAAPCAQASTSGTGAVTQAHALAGANSARAATSGTGAVTQAHALAASACSQASTSSAGSISQAHALAAAACARASTSSTGAISQAHQLAAAACAQAGISSTAAISLGAGVVSLSAALVTSIRTQRVTPRVTITF